MNYEYNYNNLVEKIKKKQELLNNNINNKA